MEDNLYKIKLNVIEKDQEYMEKRLDNLAADMRMVLNQKFVVNEGKLIEINSSIRSLKNSHDSKEVLDKARFEQLDAKINKANDNITSLTWINIILTVGLFIAGMIFR